MQHNIKNSSNCCYRFTAHNDLSVHLKMQIRQKVPGNLDDKLMLFQAHFIKRQKNLQPHCLASLFANAEKMPNCCVIVLILGVAIVHEA